MDRVNSSAYPQFDFDYNSDDTRGWNELFQGNGLLYSSNPLLPAQQTFPQPSHWHTQLHNVEQTLPIDSHYQMLASPTEEHDHTHDQRQSLAWAHSGMGPVQTPSDSTQSPGYSNSHCGGSPAPSMLSPRNNLPAYSLHPGDIDFRFGGFCSGEEPVFEHRRCFVTMDELHPAKDQPFTNAPVSASPSYDEPPSYQSTLAEAQEGYEPMKDEEDAELSVEAWPFPNDNSDSVAADEASRSPHIGCFQDPSTRARQPTPAYKVSKQRHHADKKPARRGRRRSFVDAIPDAERPFTCPFAIYGCESSFKSKNEWKRHVSTQHMRLGHWRCNQCPPREKHNDFNRKDLFVQHVRRMHLPGSGAAASAKQSSRQTKSLASKSTLNKRQTASRNLSKRGSGSADEDALLRHAADDCFVSLRQPPQQTGCLFCKETFHDSGNWEQRMEHIGQHMEAMKRGEAERIAPAQWFDDLAMEAWLVSERLVAEGTYGLVLADGRE